jgi:hypothetical protein
MEDLDIEDARLLGGVESLIGQGGAAVGFAVEGFGDGLFNHRLKGGAVL